MHSPSRNVISMTNPITTSAALTTKQTLQSPQLLNNLSQTLSTSANTLSIIDNQIHHQPIIQQQKQPLSPPYYHSVNSQLSGNQSALRSPDVPSSAANSFLDNSNNNSFTTNVLTSADIQVESPKNVTIVQPAKFQPYKEVTKPFEMSDFYKYSTKFRQKTASTVPTAELNNQSPQLPPKNVPHQHYNHLHPRSGVNL